MDETGSRLRWPKASAFVFFALVFAACEENPQSRLACPAVATAGAESPPSGPREGGAAKEQKHPSQPTEPSVRPGVNDPYFNEGALQRYTAILEAESREVVEHRDAIVDAIRLRKGMVVADIGAGTGLFTTELARRVGDEGRVLAVDIVPSFLRRIEERVRAQGLSNVRVIEGKERATGLPEASVDVAFLCDTYHHIEFPESYLQSLFDTLRPGGALILVDFERIEGVTHPSLLRHVRAGKGKVIREVTEVGFVLVSEGEADFLEENYFLRFRRP